MSRASRFSLGSGVLDDDTNNLGSETTRWWKNLESNTLVQMSIGSNALHETTRHLNSNSEIESENERALWWKALDATEEQFESVAEKYIKLDRTKEFTTTSESEEEPRILKKRYALRTKAKKTQGNEFVKVLNGSVTSLVSEPVHRISASVNELSGDKTVTDIEQGQKNSARRSEKPTEILRLKHKALAWVQRRNIFDDVSNRNESQTTSKSRSLKRSLLSNKADRGFRDATDSPIIKQGGACQLILFESDHDVSHFSVPEAQSTLLNITTLSGQTNSRNSSDTEVIRKRKPKLSKPQNKDAKKNIFEDILAEEKDQDEEEKSKSAAKSSKLHIDVSKKSISPADCLFKIPKIILKRIDAPEKNVEVVRQSLDTDDSIIPSSQNVKKSIEHDKLYDFIESDSSSSSSRKFTKRQKLRSTFFKKLRSVSKNNIQDALEEDDADKGKMLNIKDIADKEDVGTSKIQTWDAIISQMNFSPNRSSAISTHKVATSKKIVTTLSRSNVEEHQRKESVLHREDEHEALEGHSRTSSSSSRIFSTLLYSTDEDDEPMKRASSRNSRKSPEWSIHSAADTSEQSNGSKILQNPNGTVTSSENQSGILKSIQIAKDINSLRTQDKHSITPLQRHRATSENSGISIENTRTSGEREVSLPRSIGEGHEGKESVLYGQDKLDVLKEHDKAYNNEYPWMCSVLSDSSDDESKRMEEMKNRSASKLQHELKDTDVQENITTPKKQTRHSTVSQKQRASRENGISTAGAKTSQRRTENTSRSVDEERKKKRSILHEEDDRGLTRKYRKTPRILLTGIHSDASSSSNEGDEKMEEIKNISTSKLQEPLENIPVDKNISTPKRQTKHSTISQEQSASKEISKIPTENSRIPNGRTVNSSRSVNEEVQRKGNVLQEEDERGVSRKHSKTPRKWITRMYSDASSSPDEGDENMEEIKNRSASKLQEPLENIPVDKNISTTKRQTRHSTISQEQSASKEISKILIENSRVPNRRTVNSSRSINEERKKKGSLLHEDERGVSRKHSQTSKKSFTRIHSTSSSSDEENKYLEQPNRRTINLSRIVNKELKKKGNVLYNEESEVTDARTTSPSILSSEFSTIANVSDNEYRQSAIYPVKVQEERNNTSKIQEKSAKNRKSVQAEETNDIPRKQTKYSTLSEKLVSPPKDKVKSGLDKSKESRSDLNGPENISTATTVYQPIDKGPNVRETHSKILDEPGHSMLSTTSYTSRSKIVSKGQQNIQTFFSAGKQRKEEVKQTHRKSLAPIYFAASSSSDEGDRNMEEIENRSASKLQEPLENIPVDKNSSTPKRQTRHSTILQEQVAVKETNKVSIKNSRVPNRRTVNSSRSVNEELQRKGNVLQEEDERDLSRKHSKAPRILLTRIHSDASSSSNEGDEKMEEIKNRSASKLQEPLENIPVDKNSSTPKRQTRHSTILQEQVAVKETNKVSIKNSRVPNRRTVNSSRSVNEELQRKGNVLQEEDERDLSRKHSKAPRILLTRIHSDASSSSNEGDEKMEEIKNRSASKLQESLENIPVDKNSSTPKKQTRHSTISQEQVAVKETNKVSIENSRVPNRRTVNSSRSVNEELQRKGNVLQEEDERGLSRKHSKAPRILLTRIHSDASSSSNEGDEKMEEIKNRSASKLQEPLENIPVDKNSSTPKKQTRHSTISQEQVAVKETNKVSIENSRVPNRRTVNSSRSVNEELQRKGNVLQEEDERGLSRKHSKAPRILLTRIHSDASSSSNEGDEKMEEIENRSASKLQEPLENIPVDKNSSTPKRQTRHSTILQEQVAVKDTNKVSIKNSRVPNRRTVNSSRSVNEELQRKGNVLQEEDERGLSRKHSKAPRILLTRIHSDASSSSNEGDEKMEEIKNRSASKLQEPLENIPVDKNSSTPKKQTRHSTISQEQVAVKETNKVCIENSRVPNRRTVNSSRSVNEELQRKGNVLQEEDERGLSRKHSKAPRILLTRIHSDASSSSNEGDEKMEEIKNRSASKLQESLENIPVDKNISTPKRQTRHSTISQEQSASKEISKILTENSRIPNGRTVNSSRSVNEELQRKGNVHQEEERDVLEADTRLSSVLSTEFSTLANVPDDKHRKSVISPVKIGEKRNDASKIQEKSAKNRKSVQAEETNDIPRKQTKYSTLSEKLVSPPKDKVKSGLDKSKESRSDLNGPENISTATTVYQPIDKGPNVRETQSKILDEPGPSMLSRKSFTSRSKIVSKGQKNIQDFFSVGKLIPASQGFANKQKKEEVKLTLGKIRKLDIAALTASQIAARQKSPVRRTRRKLRTSARNRPTDQTQNRQTKAYNKYKNPRLPRPKYWVTDRLYNHLWKRLEPRYSRNSRAVSEKFVLQLGEVTTMILKQKSYLKYKVVLHTLMKEMARLGIIRTVLDFYHFCQDFLPSELRFKMIPMALPGNKTNIPFNPDTLNNPLIEEE